MNNNNNTIPYEYKPISMWGYLGYSLLFCIPIAGFILAIVWSFGSGNINLRNFARSQFCLVILAAIVFGICYVRGLIGG